MSFMKRHEKKEDTEENINVATGFFVELDKTLTNRLAETEGSWAMVLAPTDNTHIIVFNSSSQERYHLVKDDNKWKMLNFSDYMHGDKNVNPKLRKNYAHIKKLNEEDITNIARLLSEKYGELDRSKLMTPSTEDVAIKAVLEEIAEKMRQYPR